MKDYSNIETILNSQKIAQTDQDILRKFLSSFSFEKRQQLMGILIGHSENIVLFIDLLKKKIEFQKRPTEALAAEILKIENNEVQRLVQELA